MRVGATFQSTLPRGERQHIRELLKAFNKFQSTLPRGERPSILFSSPPQRAFQSTLPRGERRAVQSSFIATFCFNPRSRAGSDCPKANLGFATINPTTCAHPDQIVHTYIQLSKSFLDRHTISMIYSFREPPGEFMFAFGSRQPLRRSLVPPDRASFWRQHAQSDAASWSPDNRIASCPLLGRLNQ